jgi:DNA-binding transcriptional ArsR family regulator
MALSFIDEGRQQAAEAEKTILEALAAGVKNVLALADESGLNERRIRRALRRLTEAGVVKKVGGGRYALAAGHAADPVQTDGGWFWQNHSFQEKPNGRSEDEVLIPEIVPSHQRPPRQEKVVVVADEADLFQKLRETFVTGFCDAGGRKEMAVHIADKQTRYFLAENQLLGATKIKDATISELYSFAFGMGEESRRQRLKEQRQAEQDALLREQAEQQRRDMAIRTKELEKQRQAEALGKQLLVKLINQLKNNPNPFPYPILREYGIPDDEHEQWISYAKKLIAR